eukprot:TRINITY_DN37996_c0_g1_i1.p1 TRINITY_DN37996_c0_g1~~TRINITY_DN37996_c0_g1_i1.p1  ORF type:complete len:338 (+),score=74.02 TRINITY_DN37996_c0_g1_i1:116-1129(+)
MQLPLQRSSSLPYMPGSKKSALSGTSLGASASAARLMLGTPALSASPLQRGDSWTRSWGCGSALGGSSVAKDLSLPTPSSSSRRARLAEEFSTPASNRSGERPTSASSTASCAGLSAASAAPPGPKGEARLMLAIEADVDIGCWMSLEKGEADGPELPLIVQAGRPCSCNFRSTGDDVEGSLVLEGFDDAVPFRVCAPPAAHAVVTFGGSAAPVNYVVRKGLTQATVTAAAASRVTSGLLPPGAAGAAGLTAEVSISKGNPARLLVRLRKATSAEAHHQLQRDRHGVSFAAAEDNSAEGDVFASPSRAAPADSLSQALAASRLLDDDPASLCRPLTW